MDWSLTNSTRVMVRYTQDSWVASNLAGGTDGVWGDSATSVVGSDWDQPGKSLVAQLNQTHRVEDDEHADLLLLGQHDQRQRGPETPRWSTQLN